MNKKSRFLFALMNENILTSEKSKETQRRTTGLVLWGSLFSPVFLSGSKPFGGCIIGRNITLKKISTFTHIQTSE
jgi:hypothetical protein